jgi:MFS family permease
VVLQTPIGWASDRWGRRAVLVVCALLTSLGAVGLPWLIDLSTPLVYLFLFVWGACAYGVTTVSLATISDRFTGAQLLSCSAAMTMAGGFGGVAGPSAIGVLQGTLGANVFPHAVLLIFLALAAVVVSPLYRGRPAAVPG